MKNMSELGDAMSQTMPDVIQFEGDRIQDGAQLLRVDHQKVKDLFAKFEAAKKLSSKTAKSSTEKVASVKKTNAKKSSTSKSSRGRK